MTRLSYIRTVWIDDQTCVTFGFDAEGHQLTERPATEQEQRRTRFQKGGNC